MHLYHCWCISFLYSHMSYMGGYWVVYTSIVLTMYIECTKAVKRRRSKRLFGCSFLDFFFKFESAACCCCCWKKKSIPRASIIFSHCFCSTTVNVLSWYNLGNSKRYQSKNTKCMVNVLGIFLDFFSSFLLEL